MRLSSLYETRPMYVEDQPLYLNAVGEVGSSLTPQRMLSTLQGIEKDLGRDRSKETRMGPRTLDLDILLCGQTVMESRQLTIPHPRIKERLFVLVPLLELAPDLLDPKTGEPYLRSLQALDAARDPAQPRGVYLYSSR
jgi:2-amino-4-hydroxy-6-hydroxymethyldihydropteridine diphosphokinase